MSDSSSGHHCRGLSSDVAGHCIFLPHSVRYCFLVYEGRHLEEEVNGNVSFRPVEGHVARTWFVNMKGKSYS